MPVPTLTPLYAAALALLFVAISVRTLRLRRHLRIVIGDGANETMLRAMRAHANFAEYTPLALLLIFFVELQAQATWLIHLLCLSLVIGRLSHAHGVSRSPENHLYLVFGMAMTFSAIIIAALILFALTMT